jgi:raffinose/stachyose/melibiose transport system permease protein
MTWQQTRGGGRGNRRPPLRNSLYLVPALALLGALVYFSVIYTIWLSTQDWNGFGPNPLFVGADNYIQVFNDAVYWQSMLNVAGFMVLILIQMAYGLLMAVALHSRVVLCVAYRIALFVPVVLAPAVMAPAFREIFAPDGQFNRVLGAIGLGTLRHPWLADPDTAIFALAAIAVWCGTGFSFILYYAALTQVDPRIFEAARVDGAGSLRMLWSITIPLMTRAHLTYIVLGTIATIKLFDIPQIITGGGPANSTQFPATYIYQAGVVNFKAGYGAAMTVVMIAICVVLAIAQLRLGTRAARNGA